MIRRHLSALYLSGPGSPRLPFPPSVLGGLGRRGADPSKVLERKRRLSEDELPPATHFRFRPNPPQSVEFTGVGLASCIVTFRTPAPGSCGSCDVGSGPRSRAQGPGRRGVGERRGRLHGGATLKPWHRGSPFPRSDASECPRGVDLFPFYN